MGSDPININDLGAHLQARIKDPETAMIYLRADEEVPYGTVVQGHGPGPSGGREEHQRGHPAGTVAGMLSAPPLGEGWNSPFHPALESDAGPATLRF